MRTSLITAVARLVRAGRARLDRSDEGGFILLEVMISLSLITAIMAGVTVQYVNGVVVSGYQRSVATASQVASSALTDLRSVSATDLLRGRSAADVTAQRKRLTQDLGEKVAARVQSGEDYLAYDNAADPVVVPTATEDVSDGPRSLKVETYLECQEPAPVRSMGTAPNTVLRRDCLDSTTAGAVNGLRAIVAVSWSARGCPSSGCAFVATTLIDPHGNPTFDPQQALPPKPVIVKPADQTVVIGDQVSLQLRVEEGGAAPFTWLADTLPTGLSISPGGLVTGTVGGSPTTVTTKVTVTDAFSQQSTASFGWTVLARLALTVPPNQAHIVDEQIEPVTLSASGGSGGYRYTDPDRTLPAGLSLDAATGRITGTPTTVATYTVRPVVTDSSGRTATASFTWNVVVPPFAVTNPGPQVATVNRPFPADRRVTASGGSGQGFTYAATGMPAGVSIDSSTGLIGGTPTAVGGPVTVTVSVTDTGSRLVRRVTFTIEVVGPPTITTPGAQTTTRGGSARVQVVASCPNGPCASYAIVNQPKGLTIDANGLISGTLTSDAAASTTVRVTVTDRAGATATTNDFAWSIVAPPTARALPNITTPRVTAVTRDFSGTFSGGTTPYTYSASGLPAGLSIDPSTGVVTGTTADVNSKNAVTIRIVDSSGMGASSSFTWHVTNLKLDHGDLVIFARNNSYSADLRSTRFTTGGTGPYTYTGTGMIGNPDLWLDGTIFKTAPRPEKVGVYNVTLTVTDSQGATFTDNVKVDIRK